MCACSQLISSPSQSCCHALSSEIKHNTFRRRNFSHLRPLAAARPENPVPPVIECSHSRDSPLPYSIGEEQRMGPPESQSEILGILVHPSLSGRSLSSTNLLYREDFLLSVRSWCGLVSDRAVSFVRPLECVWVWNSAGRILMRNHLHSPYPQKDVVLLFSRPHDTYCQNPPSQ